MPKHRTTFTSAEWTALGVLVEHLRRAPKEERELLRCGMRGLGFYIRAEMGRSPLQPQVRCASVIR